MSQSNLNFHPLTSHFGAQVTGLTIAQGVDESTLKRLAQALIEYKLIVIRNQSLSPDQYANFGRMWTGKTRVDSFTEMHVPGYDDINIVGNVGDIFKDEGYRNGAAFWHTDCAYLHLETNTQPGGKLNGLGTSPSSGGVWFFLPGTV